MSKPISYYLSSAPPFPLESIERMEPSDRINFACSMLEMYCSTGMTDNRLRQLMIMVSMGADVSASSLAALEPARMVRLAAAILMVATDDLELLKPENLIV